MSESESVYQADEKVWDYIKENPRAIGIPITEKQGLDILNALRDIYNQNKVNPKLANDMLTMLAGVLLAAAQGDGAEIIEEVLVQEAMFKFDENIREVLNEE
jgi:hypothetical protein